ncbi:hypothetical protein CAPTEDRAFT_18338 [Capitella teleta]|uniref:Uncharacterized protein n=1 Tax=Capitella teleta TaxID=283909 RepID=R7V702_CAPTE|nr:hypothetical protein CAPTEDRAFT_18338 [Capitella teleta]|eukprot:ELU14212.1 hypothetical protein CAPTEDRAFT_18338 [Capitella teleta]
MALDTLSTTLGRRGVVAMGGPCSRKPIVDSLGAGDCHTWSGSTKHSTELTYRAVMVHVIPNAHRSLIKPVAFKPVLPPHCSTPKRLPPPTPHQMMMSSAASAASSHRSSSSSYSVHSSPGSSSCSAPPPSQPGPPPPHAASSPQLYSSARMPSLDDGYASQQDFMHDRPLAVTYVSDFHSHMEGAGSAAGSSKDMHAAASVVDSYVTTPSPSDSGVGEVEALIRVKEEELAKLRDTMERNEAAILQVHAERQQNWLMEMREVADEWERRLRAQQQKAFRSEQSLIMQLFRLQQERKQLKTNAEELRESRDALTREIAAVKRECDVLRSKADEASWELQQKAGEISLLKAQLKEAKEEASSRSSCLLELKNQLREGAQDKDARLAEICRLKAESERTQSELDAAKEIVQQTQRQLEVIRQNTAAPMDVLQLREELSAALSELASVKSENVKQKEQWLEEKNKVIRYQKHLQLNYTQMHRKNKMLESEIQQLTLELENRDIQLSDIQNDERQESMC